MILLAMVGGSASAQTHSAQFSWTASVSSGVTGYNIYRAPCTGTVSGATCSAAGTFIKLTASPVSGTSFTDSSAALVAGSKWDAYATSVCPTCNPGESAPSNHQAFAVPLDGQPQPPQNFLLALLARIWGWLKGLFV